LLSSVSSLTTGACPNFYSISFCCDFKSSHLINSFEITTLYHIQCICRHNVYLRRLEAFTRAFAGATKIIYANQSSEEGSVPISVKCHCFVIENHEINLVKLYALITFTLKLKGFYKTKYIAVMLT